MKTQTTNPTKIGENTNTRNFFKKKILVLAVLAFTSFGFKAKAQTFTIDVVNTTTTLPCTWTITVYDNASPPNVLATYSCPSTGGSVIKGCGTGVPDYITLSKPGCTTIPFGSGGSFPYTAVTPSCTSCTSSITCAGGFGTGICTPPPASGDVHLLVEIKP